MMASHHGASLRDPDRIQTCNLLIRSQMLYSVELRSLYVHPLRGVCECKGTFYFPSYQIFCYTSLSILDKGDTRRTGTSRREPLAPRRSDSPQEAHITNIVKGLAGSIPRSSGTYRERRCVHVCIQQCTRLYTDVYTRVHNHPSH